MLNKHGKHPHSSENVNKMIVRRRVMQGIQTLKMIRYRRALFQLYGNVVCDDFGMLIYISSENLFKFFNLIIIIIYSLL